MFPMLVNKCCDDIGPLQHSVMSHALSACWPWCLAFLFMSYGHVHDQAVLHSIVQLLVAYFFLFMWMIV